MALEMALENSALENDQEKFDKFSRPCQKCIGHKNFKVQGYPSSGAEKFCQK